MAHRHYVDRIDRIESGLSNVLHYKSFIPLGWPGRHGGAVVSKKILGFNLSADWGRSVHFPLGFLPGALVSSHSRKYMQISSTGHSKLSQPVKS